MKNKYGFSITVVVMALCMFLMSLSAQAALDLEGQSGIFLNTLAYPLSQNKLEVSSHNVDLDSLGSVTTYNFATGIGNNAELGYTKIASSVTGVKDQNVFFGKLLVNKETKTTPALAIWVQSRNLVGSDNTADFGLSATKAFNVGKHTTVLDFGARSTKAQGLGLFGIGNDRKIKFEGSLAFFVTPKFAVGTEFKQQINAEAWTDIAFRYIASSNLNIDAGIADLGPGLGNQIALAATWSK